MKWPWSKPPTEHPDPDQARDQLRRVKEQRAEVEQLVAEVRIRVARNNFAAKVFALDPSQRKR